MSIRRDHAKAQEGCSSQTEEKDVVLREHWRELSLDYQKVEGGVRRWRDLHEFDRRYREFGNLSALPPPVPAWLREDGPVQEGSPIPEKDEALFRLVTPRGGERLALSERREQFIEAIREYIGGPREAEIVQKVISLGLNGEQSLNMKGIAREICQLSRIPEAQSFLQLQQVVERIIPSLPYWHSQWEASAGKNIGTLQKRVQQYQGILKEVFAVHGDYLKQLATKDPGFSSCLAKVASIKEYKAICDAVIPKKKPEEA